jgi:hypothetical protein
MPIETKRSRAANQPRFQRVGREQRPETRKVILFIKRYEAKGCNKCFAEIDTEQPHEAKAVPRVLSEKTDPFAKQCRGRWM